MSKAFTAQQNNTPSKSPVLGLFACVTQIGYNRGMHQHQLPDKTATDPNTTDWFPDPDPNVSADLLEALPDIVRDTTESRVGQIWRPEDERELEEQMHFFVALLLPALK